MTGITFKVCLELLLRLILLLIIVNLEHSEAFKRKIQEDELWLYKNPMTQSYVPAKVLWCFVVIGPTFVFSCVFLVYRDKIDFSQAILSLSLALGLNGVITNTIKIVIGRPRPDFLSRCFPDGHVDINMACTGDLSIVNEGRKSFPSGHASFAFVGFGFIALYLAGKWHTFNFSGKTQSWKLCCFIFPLMMALFVALSRTCDYHHHWQDVSVGSVLGFVITYLCYRHYFPPLTSKNCHKSYLNIFYDTENEDSVVGLTKSVLSKRI